MLRSSRHTNGRFGVCFLSFLVTNKSTKKSFGENARGRFATKLPQCRVRCFFIWLVTFWGNFYAVGPDIELESIFLVRPLHVGRFTGKMNTLMRITVFQHSAPSHTHLWLWGTGFSRSAPHRTRKWVGAPFPTHFREKWGRTFLKTCA